MGSIVAHLHLPPHEAWNFSMREYWDAANALGSKKDVNKFVPFTEDEKRRLRAADYKHRQRLKDGQ